MENSEKTVTMAMDEYNRLIKIEKNQDRIVIQQRFYTGFSWDLSYKFIGENEALKLLQEKHNAEISSFTERFRTTVADKDTTISALRMEVEELKNKKHWWNR